MSRINVVNSLLLIPCRQQFLFLTNLTIDSSSSAVLLLASSHSSAIKSAVNRASTFNQGEHSCFECSIASCIIFLAPFNSSSYLCLLRLDVRSGNSGLSFDVEFSFWCRWYQLNSRSKFCFHCVVFCNLKRKKHQIWQVLYPCRPTLARSKGSIKMITEVLIDYSSTKRLN